MRPSGSGGRHVGVRLVDGRELSRPVTCGTVDEPLFVGAGERFGLGVSARAAAVDSGMNLCADAEWGRESRWQRRIGGRGRPYDALVATFVLTVIGDDRVGLVEALADTVSTHGGNWEHSQMAELAGKFAGIVVVTVPADRAADLTCTLRALDGLLEVSAYPGMDAAADQRHWPQLTLDLIGNDRPGIVREVSAVLSRHGLSIEAITTDARDTPMVGGMIFEAHVVARLPPSSDPAAVRADLERLAAELMVDVSAAEK